MHPVGWCSKKLGARPRQAVASASWHQAISASPVALRLHPRLPSHFSMLLVLRLPLPSVPRQAWRLPLEAAGGCSLPYFFQVASVTSSELLTCGS